MTNSEIIAAAKSLHAEMGYHLGQMGRFPSDAGFLAGHAAEVTRCTGEIAALLNPAPVEGVTIYPEPDAPIEDAPGPLAESTAAHAAPSAPELVAAPPRRRTRG